MWKTRRDMRRRGEGEGTGGWGVAVVDIGGTGRKSDGV